MKQRLSRVWRVGLALSLLPFVSGCPKTPTAVSQKVAGSEPQIEPEPALVFHPVPEGENPADPVAESPVSEAAVTRISTEKPLPPDIDPNSPLAEVLKLADSGVEESVLLAYVSGATAEFELDPDAIIFLNDIGIPPQVVAGMIEHDRILRENAASAVAAAPMPEEMAPTEPVVASAPSYSVLPESTAPADEAIPVSYNTGSYVPAPAQPYEDSGESASYFYDSLAPYGSWVDVDGYGRCWQPTVVVLNPGWRPYCDRGSWVYTDCGWYWVSEYSWGWAPFHYGRWFRHARLGWCWSPDNVWGPSWVSWRYSDDHCGWAPLPPRACYTSSGFTYYGRPVSFSFNFGLGADCYTFIPLNRFHEKHISRHALARDQVERVMHRTTVSTRIIAGAGHRVINQGIAPERVAAVTRREVTRATIREVTSNDGTTRPDRLEADGRTLTVHRLPTKPTPRLAPGTRHASLRNPTDVETALGSPVSPTGSAAPAPPARITRTSRQPRADSASPEANSLVMSRAIPRKAQPLTEASAPASASVVAPTENNPSAAPAQPEVASTPLTLSERIRQLQRVPSRAAVAPSTPETVEASSQALIIRGRRDARQQAQTASGEWSWQPVPAIQLGAPNQSVPAAAARRTPRSAVNHSPAAVQAPSPSEPASSAEAPANARWERSRAHVERRVAADANPGWNVPVPRSEAAHSVAPRTASGWQTPTHTPRAEPAQVRVAAPPPEPPPQVHVAPAPPPQAQSAARESRQERHERQERSEARQESGRSRR